MKNIVALIFFMTLALGACSNDDGRINPNNSTCDFGTIVSSVEYRDAPLDYLVINSLEIMDDCLVVVFSASGCDGNTWEVKLVDSEEIFESNPPQRNLKLFLKNQEDCEAFITKEMSFDISNLQVDGNQVRLNITNAEENILYEY